MRTDVNAAFDINVGRRGSKATRGESDRRSNDNKEQYMGNHPDTQKKDVEKVTSEELEDQNVDELPDREAMSLIDANVAVPVNAAVAANVLTNESVADADATQEGDIDQKNIL